MTTLDQTRVLDLELGDTWAYGPGILHGGSVMEQLASYGVSERHPHPLSTSAHFLRSARPGPAQVSVTPLRVGRSTSTTRVALAQEGLPTLDVVVTAGLLTDTEPVYLDLRPPVLPPPEECLTSAPDLEGGPNGIQANLDFRADPATAGWVDGPRDRPEIRGWLRSRVDRPLTPLALVCMADGTPPVTFAMALEGWVPTVELTVHVRAVPAPGWLRVVQRAHQIRGGWLDEDCELWDSAGQLVAQARQLAGYRPA